MASLESLVCRLEVLESLIEDRDARIATLENAINAAESTLNKKKEAEQIRVLNPNDKGMGHNSMGWLEDNACKFYSGPADRNKVHIVEVLKKHLSDSDEKGLIVEIGSGSGQHIAHFAQACPSFSFKPTEYPGHPNPRADKQDLNKILNSIEAYTKDCPNVFKPCFLDASILIQNNEICLNNEAIMFICINIVHVSPKSVYYGILEGACQKLKSGGKILFYGPWSKNGIISGEGNIKFNESLINLNPDYGLRDINELQTDAAKFGFTIIDEILFELSNNYCLVLQKA